MKRILILIMLFAAIFNVSSQTITKKKEKIIIIDTDQGLGEAGDHLSIQRIIRNKPVTIGKAKIVKTANGQTAAEIIEQDSDFQITLGDRVAAIKKNEDEFLLTDPYIDLQDGSRIFGSVKIKNPLLAKAYVLYNDSVKYKYTDISALKNEDGYFRTIKKDLVQRIKHGRIDLYRKFENTFSPGYNMAAGSGQAFVGGHHSTKEVSYFTKNDGDVQNVNLKNLKTALNDNAESMRYLKRHSTTSLLKYMGIASGVAISLISLSNTEGGDESGLPAGVYIGCAVTSISLFIPNKNIHRAIEVYNQ